MYLEEPWAHHGRHGHGGGAGGAAGGGARAARCLRQGVAEDVSQYTLGLVKSFYPEADLEPIGDGMAPNTSDVAWSNYLADARPIVERVATDLHL